ncbi:MAG: winged helix-turn-helix transcriptional regulator [Candidatus Aminicenantes bacterium]|nr:winged helix-turn-helix transcriptional regulator [Candidatus Aminicenantes bacterium]
MKKSIRAYASSARKLKAMGHPARLGLLAELARSERCVGRLQSCLNLSQPHVSQSLKILRAAGIVAGRRDKNQVCYRIVDPAVRRILTVLKVKETLS